MDISSRAKYSYIVAVFILFQLILLGVIALLDLMGVVLVDELPNSVVLGVGLELVLALVIFLLMLLLNRYFSNFYVEFKDDYLLVRKGLFTLSEIKIPYSSIKSIKLVKSGVHVLDPIFGLSAISIEWKSGLCIIPGLTQPDVFHKRLVSHINTGSVNSDLYLSDHELLLKTLKQIYNLSDRLDNLETKFNDLKQTVKSSTNSGNLLLPKPKEDKELINIPSKSKRKPKR